MTRIRPATILIACLILALCATHTFASDDLPPLAVTTRAPLTLNGHAVATLGPLDADFGVARAEDAIVPLAPDAGGQRGFRRGRRGRHQAAVTAIMLGAVGTIAGAAVLVYANRPECSANANLNGCGYGTKVVGGSVMAAGLVGIFTGALLWR